MINSGSEQISYTFLLVHGAFHGAWCWRDVSARLLQAGYKVYVPALTGLGERAHLAHPGVDLATHVRDVVQLIECEELSNVILVGHSYAGYVVAGVAGHCKEKISRLMLLDSYLPTDGTHFFSHIAAGTVAQITANLLEGYLVPAFPPEFFGVLPAGSTQWEWVKQRLTPQPLATFQQKLMMACSWEGLAKTYIRCTLDMLPEDDPVYRQIKDLSDWNYRQLAGPHDAMVMVPGALSDLLVQEAGRES